LSGNRTTYLLRKLERYVTLPRSAQAGLEQLAAVECRHLAPREDVFRAGDAPRHVNLILEGWACRYVLLEHGRRQISAILLPGDLCDLHMSVLKAADHSVGALTAMRVVQIAPDRLKELAGAHPELDAALAWNALVEESIARAWIASIGQRSATERLAHLFCELFTRLEAVGLVDGDSCAFPLTQEQLADAVGISTVHVNRSLMDLRSLGLITLKEKTLTILDREALMRLAMFDPSYLHFER
jgi:CRP-like cAMP-binding protein